MPETPLPSRNGARAITFLTLALILGIVPTVPPASGAPPSQPDPPQSNLPSPHAPPSSRAPRHPRQAAGGQAQERPIFGADVELEIVNVAVLGGGTALYDATIVVIREMAFAAGSEQARLFARFSASTADEGDILTTVPMAHRAGGCPVATDPSRPVDPSMRRRQAVVIVSDGEESGSSGSTLGRVSLATEATGLPLFLVELRDIDADVVYPRVTYRSTIDAVVAGPPREFTAQITLSRRSGEELYDERLTLHDLDDPASNAAGLREHVDEIAKKLAGGR